jgi:hypothetical protein
MERTGFSILRSIVDRTSELLREFGWMRERVLQIRLALLGDGKRLVPLRE